MGPEAEIGEAEKLISTRKNAIALLFHLRVGGRRNDDHVDHAGFQRRQACRVGAERENFEVFFGIDSGCLIIKRAATSGVAPKLLMPSVLPLRSLTI